MNRKKKLNDKLKSKVKKANAKLRSTNKAKYISKADRAKLEVESSTTTNESEAQ